MSLADTLGASRSPFRRSYRMRCQNSDAKQDTRDNGAIRPADASSGYSRAVQRTTARSTHATNATNTQQRRPTQSRRRTPPSSAYPALASLDGALSHSVPNAFRTHSKRQQSECDNVPRPALSASASSSLRKGTTIKRESDSVTGSSVSARRFARATTASSRLSVVPSASAPLKREFSGATRPDKSAQTGTRQHHQCRATTKGAFDRAVTANALNAPDAPVHKKRHHAQRRRHTTSSVVHQQPAGQPQTEDSVNLSTTKCLAATPSYSRLANTRHVRSSPPPDNQSLNAQYDAVQRPSEDPSRTDPSSHNTLTSYGAHTLGSVSTEGFRIDHRGTGHGRPQSTSHTLQRRPSLLGLPSDDLPGFLMLSEPTPPVVSALSCISPPASLRTRKSFSQLQSPTSIVSNRDIPYSPSPSVAHGSNMVSDRIVESKGGAEEIRRVRPFNSSIPGSRILNALFFRQPDQLATTVRIATALPSTVSPPTELPFDSQYASAIETSISNESATPSDYSLYGPEPDYGRRRRRLHAPSTSSLITLDSLIDAKDALETLHAAASRQHTAAENSIAKEPSCPDIHYPSQLTAEAPQPDRDGGIVQMIDLDVETFPNGLDDALYDSDSANGFSDAL